MEPCMSSDANSSSSDIHRWLQERLIGNDMLSVFKLPKVGGTMALKKNPSLNLTVNKDVGDPQTSKVEARAPTRKVIASYEADCTSSRSSEICPNYKSNDRELPAFVTSTPRTTHDMFQALSSLCTSVPEMDTTQPKSNIIEDDPTCFRITNSQHTTISGQSSNSYAGGKNSKKKHSLSGIHNCHIRIAHGTRFQKLSDVHAPLHKRRLLTRDSTAGRGELDPFSPPILSTSNRFMKRLSSKNTRITVSLPPMSDSIEQQLITVFFEISKLHGCNFSVDRKGTTLENKGDANYLLPSAHIPVSSQEHIPEISVTERKPWQTAGTESREAPSHSTFFNLPALRSQLHSFGTHLVAQPQQQQLHQSSGSDSDGSLPMYPEVIMNSSP